MLLISTEPASNLQDVLECTVDDYIRRVARKTIQAYGFRKYIWQPMEAVLASFTGLSESRLSTASFT